MTYLMAGRASELDRLQLQSRVWEPAGARMLAALGDGTGWRTLDVGCGCLGWVRLLSHWVGPNGTCVGSDVDDRLLEAATVVVDTDALANVKLVRDDLFDSRLAPGSFDLVHARFQLAPLGRFSEQIDSYARLLRPGGTLVLEDPDTSSWRFEPPATATGQLISLIIDAFQQSGGDFNAGRRGYDLFVDRGWQPRLRADIVALPPRHPYLRLPLQFATSLRPKLLELLDEATLDDCIATAGVELSDPRRRGLTFTLIQTWATAE